MATGIGCQPVFGRERSKIGCFHLCHAYIAGQVNNYDVKVYD